jgi:hypothetical protein
MESKRNAFPHHTDGLELQEAGRDLLVHDPSLRKIHVLNTVAGAVLRLCDGQHSVDAIVAVISASNQGTDRAAVERDVERILDDFARLGLLR